jgi:xylan 1,4-beta-xylosidase
VGVLAAALAGACAPAAVANPVAAGDHPDPSLIRADGAWYAASTSSDWLPAFPILRSSGLGGWRQAGAVLMRRPRWAARDFWAPELVRRGALAFAYYAAQARDGRRCLGVASAPRLLGPYSDHGPLLCTRVGEIDPLPVLDEQSAPWLVWKQDGNSLGRPTPILAAPLTPGGSSLGTPPQELFRADAPWERGLVEAPALLRHDGMLYMIYSAGHCCGRHCHYATGVARSSTLLGPWEKRPEPILTSDSAFRCPGHVSVARGPDGELVAAYHAYVRGDPADRQLLVAPLHFDVEGWPRVSPAHDVATLPTAAHYDFGNDLGEGWEWPVGPRPAARVANGRLVLGRGALGRQTGTSRFTARAVVAATRGGARPGLAVMSADGNAVGVELRGGGRVAVWRSVEGRRTTILDRPPYGWSKQDRRSRSAANRSPHCCRSRVKLRVSVGRHVKLAVGIGGRRWQPVGRPQPLPRWASGPRAALTVTGPPGARAEFDSLSIDPR